jgi:hypothetical protein
LLVAVAAVALVVGACSGDDAVDTTLPPPTTVANTTTTAAPTTTTTAAPTTTVASTTTTIAAPSDTVGSPQALAELIASIQQELAGSYPDIVDAEIPIPDLTNPDPVVAVEELNEFGQWINANYPANEWNQVRAFPGSPEEDLFERNNESLYFERQRLVRSGEPWVYHGGEVVALDAVEIPVSTLDGLPANAVAVVYRSSSGPIDVVDAESGDVLEIIDGWTSREALSLLIPTGTGWAFWDTLLDPGVSSA